MTSGPSGPHHKKEDGRVSNVSRGIIIPVRYFSNAGDRNPLLTGLSSSDPKPGSTSPVVGCTPRTRPISWVKWPRDHHYTEMAQEEAASSLGGFRMVAVTYTNADQPVNT